MNNSPIIKSPRLPEQPGAFERPFRVKFFNLISVELRSSLCGVKGSLHALRLVEMTREEGRDDKGEWGDSLITIK